MCGCGNSNEVTIDYDTKVFTINGTTLHEGDWISIDGSTGNIYAGSIKTVAATGTPICRSSWAGPTSAAS